MALLLFLFVTLILINMPIAFVIGIAGSGYFLVHSEIPWPVLVQRVVAQTQSFTFLAVPFFLFAGNLMNETGITKHLLSLARLLTRKMYGGVAQVDVILSTLMGGVSGSAVADAGMEIRILGPEMDKLGYPKGYTASLTCLTSLITATIPPSLGLILFGFVGEVSIGRLFIGGMIPGLLMCVALMIAVTIISKKRGYAPSRPRRATLGEIGRQALKSFWALFFPLGIIMGMRFGIFTPTEAGGVGVLYCLIVGKFVYKGLKKEHFIPILRETISGTATVMLIIVSATVFGYYLNWENIPTMLLNAVTSFASNKFLVLLVMNVVLLIVGMFLEGGAALIILAPLMVPIVKAAGIDLVHFGIVCNVNIMIGGLTPPFGSMMFTCVSITDCKMQEFIKECVPFIIALLLALLLLTYIPGITMLIPNLIY